MNKKCCVITTINEPTLAIQKFIEETDYDVIIVGDTKTPNSYKELNCVFLDVDTQHQMFPDISRKIPVKHYCRKNLGYLFALKEGYNIIAETDDDTFPLEGWGDIDLLKKNENHIINDIKYPNIYSLYTDKKIWARGYPLDEINRTCEYHPSPFDKLDDVAVWQGLVDDDPDVDAIFRLSSKEAQTCFKFNSSSTNYVLGDRCIHPTNTQNTIWTDSKLFYNLYIPCTVRIRFCDILRGYVMCRTIAKAGKYIAFTPSTTYQVRNVHDLMKDFEDEIVMYTQCKNILERLDGVVLEGNVFDLPKIYKILLEMNIVDKLEIDIINAWAEYFL